MRADEGINNWNLLAQKMTAHTVVGRGGKSPLSDPGQHAYIAIILSWYSTYMVTHLRGPHLRKAIHRSTSYS